jgi:hypothetical protein
MWCIIDFLYNQSYNIFYYFFFNYIQCITNWIYNFLLSVFTEFNILLILFNLDLLVLSNIYLPVFLIDDIISVINILLGLFFHHYLPVYWGHNIFKNFFETITYFDRCYIVIKKLIIIFYSIMFKKIDKIIINTYIDIIYKWM